MASNQGERGSRHSRWSLLGSVAVASVALAVGLLALAGDPAPTTLTAVMPSRGAALAAPPVDVSLVFGGPFAPREYHLTVETAAGAPVTSSAARLAGQAVVVPVRIVDSGAYLVGYHVVLADGQEFAGVSTFTVAPGWPSGRTAPGWSSAPPDQVTQAQAPAGGGHVHGTDPLSIALTGLSLVLIVVLVTVMCRRPRLRSGA